MTTETYTAPSHWASYLINGDASGLDRYELSAANAFLTMIGDWPVDCEDAGFLWRHDAWPLIQVGADCQTYTVLKR